MPGLHQKRDVVVIGAGERPEAGRVYVAPPDMHVFVKASGALGMVRGPKGNGHRPSIDMLFRTAAAVHSCHVGHVFSLQSIVVEQAESLERALWSAVRALEESAALSDRLARRSAGHLGS